MEASKTPEIRFKVFNAAWEQRKLGEIALVTMGQSPNGACYTDNPNDAVLVQGNADLKDGWVSPRVWTTAVTKTAKAGDLIMSVRAPVGAMGKTAYDVVLGRGVAGIAGNEFLFQALSKKEAEGYWSTVSAGSTFDSINGDELRNTPVNCPRSELECETIGDCLSKVDSLITLHQRKCDKLVKLKSAMLNKMFPKFGETEPEIRFAGCNDPWEHRKLGEEFHFLGNNTLPRAELSDFRGTIRDIHYGDVLVKYGSTLDASIECVPRIADENLAQKLTCDLLRNGDIIVADTAEDETVGKCSELRGLEGLSAVSGLHTIPLRPVREYAPAFLGYYLNSSSYHDQLLPLIQGIKVISISRTALANTEMMVPDFKEQCLIGSYFYRLDSLITLHQRKLEGLRRLKTAMLDKMFV